MSGYNTNIALIDNGNAQRYGDPANRATDHQWFDQAAVMQNAGSPNYVGFWDDFLGDTLLDEWAPNLDTSSSAAINAQAGGVLRLTTHTEDNAWATLALGLHWTVSNGLTVLRTAVKHVSAVTARSVEIGFSDALSESAGEAFSSHDATPVDVAANAAIFGFNSDESMATYSALSVNGGGTPQRTADVATPTTNWLHFTIMIDAAGNAFFYTGKDELTLVATHLLAVATTALLTPWITVVNKTAATARSIDVDYVGVYGARA